MTPKVKVVSIYYYFILMFATIFYPKSTLTQGKDLDMLVSSKSSSNSDLIASAKITVPECPKFNEGHCQCIKAGINSPLMMESSNVGFANSNSSRIAGTLGQGLESSFGTTNSQLFPSSNQGGSVPSNVSTFNIACSFTKTEVIQDALQRVSHLNISSLTLIHNVIPSLHDDFFAGLKHVDKIYLKYNRIANVSENAFRGLEDSLSQLFIDEFYWYSFHFKAFDQIPASAICKLQKLTDLTISSGYLTNISQAMFEGCSNLQRLTLKGYKLAKIDDDAFADMTSLSSLELKSSTLSSVPNKALANLDNLKSLKIESRKIQNITDDAFAHLDRLEKLDLSSCSISNIEKNAFSDIGSSLKVLSLDRNSLKSLPNLGTLRKLERLDLGFNDLNSLANVSFRGMRNLKNLSLDMNGLIFLGENSFAGLENSLQSVSLTQNRLTHFPSTALNKLKALRELSLSSNLIIEIPSDALSLAGDLVDTGATGNDNSIKYDDFNSIKMHTIDLSRNRINKISGQSFKGSRDTLEILNLAMNKLTQYPTEFNEFTNLTSLDLSLNAIESLDPQTLEGSQDRLEFIGLNGNPWKCDCVMASFRIWLENWIQGLTLRDMYKMEKMIKETKCESPEELKGIPLHYPPISHLVCRDAQNKIIKTPLHGSTSLLHGNSSSKLPIYYFISVEDALKKFDTLLNGALEDEDLNFTDTHSAGDLSANGSDKKGGLGNTNSKGFWSGRRKGKWEGSTRTFAIMGFLMSLILCCILLLTTFISWITAAGRKKGYFRTAKSSIGNNSSLGSFGQLAGSAQSLGNQAPTKGPTSNNLLFNGFGNGVPKLAFGGLSSAFPPRDIIMMSPPSSDKNNSNTLMTNKTTTDASGLTPQVGKSNTGSGFLKQIPGTGNTLMNKLKGRNPLINSSGTGKDFDIDNDMFDVTDDKSVITQHEYRMPTAP